MAGGPEVAPVDAGAREQINPLANLLQGPPQGPGSAPVGPAGAREQINPLANLLHGPPQGPGSAPVGPAGAAQEHQGSAARQSDTGGSSSAVEQEVAPVDAGPREQGDPPHTSIATSTSWSMTHPVVEALHVFAAVDPATIERAGAALRKVVEGAKGDVVVSDFTLTELERLEFDKFGHAYNALAEAGIIRGAKFALDKEAERKFGPVAVKAKGSLKAFAGVYAHARAGGLLDLGNDPAAAISLQAQAFAGIANSGEGSLEVGGKDVALAGEGAWTAMAGARAELSGKASISAHGVVLEAEAAAFAGAKVEGSAESSAKLFGRKVLKLKASGTLAAGAGAGASYKFKLRGGKFTFGGKAFASAGLGGGGGAELAGDLNPVVVAVWRAIEGWRDRMGMKDFIDTRAVLTDSDSPLRAALLGYSERKWRLVRTARADNYVKVEKVQAFIDEHINRTVLKQHRIAEYDQFIKELVESTLRSPDGAVTVRVSVRHGKLMGLEEQPKDAIDKIKRHWAGELSGLTPER